MKPKTFMNWKLFRGYDKSTNEDYSCKVYGIIIFGKYYVLFSKLLKPQK